MLTHSPEKWGLPPTMLLVDYYNRGIPEAGSVFKVAAEANNVSYDYPPLEGQKSGAPALLASSGSIAVAGALLFAVLAAS